MVLRLGATNFHDDGVNIKNLSLDTKSSETWNLPTFAMTMANVRNQSLTVEGLNP